MTDVDLPPLPEPAFRLKWRDGAYYVSKPNIGNTDCYTAKQVRANVAHAIAAKDAEIDALRNRLEDTVRDSTNGIEALRAEVDRLQRQLRQAHKDYGCELRDPNGTIWEYAAAQKARAERLAEALRHLRNHTSVNSHQIELIDTALHPAAAQEAGHE